MRKALPFSVAGSIVSVLVFAGLFLPSAPTADVFWLSFPLAFLALGTALYRINGGLVGRLKWAQIWEALRELPRMVLFGLGLLFLAVGANLFVNMTGVQTELGFRRGFAGNGMWICVFGTALLYGLSLRERRGTPLEPGGSGRLVAVAFGVIGLGLGVAGFLNRGDISDESAIHERLETRFGGSTWVRHLVAANTYHGAFLVYLDTLDPAIQSAACADLAVVGSEMERAPELYHAVGNRGTFLRTC